MKNLNGVVSQCLLVTREDRLRDLGQKGSSKIVSRYLSHMRYEVEFLAHVSISLAINNTLLVKRVTQTRY